MHDYPKPYAVFSIAQGRQPGHYSEPRLSDTFASREDAEGRCQWLEGHGHLAVLVDLRESLHKQPKG